MRVFLVDFENVKSDGLRCVDCLDAGDQVITFFSKNAESMSMDTYFNLIHSKASFYAVRLDRTGSNALDFQLVSYLGYLMGTAVDQDVFVISKDHGFHSAVSFCRNFLIPQSKYHKTVSQYPSIASLYPNHAEGRAVGINDIPLFQHEEPLMVKPVEPKMVSAVAEANENMVEEVVPEVKPVTPIEISPVETIAAQPAAETIEESVLTEKEATPVQPKRRDKNHHDREHRNERPIQESKPVSVKSDWNEIMAAAEAGLQIIDMFGDSETNAVKKEAPKKEDLAKEKDTAPEAEVEIEIKDFLSPISVPQPEVTPIESEESKEESITQPVMEAVKAAMDIPEEQPTVLSGSEIDRMLEEFLEEAAAAIEAELKDMPEAEMAEYIEIETAESVKVEEPVTETEPVSNEVAAESEKAQVQPEQEEVKPDKPMKERNRKNPRNRKEKQPKESAEPVKEETVETVAVPEKPQEAVKEEAAAEAPKPKKERKPKQAKEALPEEAAPVASDAREVVKKALLATIEIKDEETADDLEKLVDCILDASGKQDLYRMIIKLFGQKTGLEYYKVVKREYTNICNQIGKK